MLEECCCGWWVMAEVIGDDLGSPGDAVGVHVQCSETVVVGIGR